MRKTILFLAGVFMLAGLALASSPEQSKSSVLFYNGMLTTAWGAGFEGADISELQTDLSMNTWGFPVKYQQDYRVADDFVVPPQEIWAIDSITFYGYQTGSSTTSPLDGLYFQIWDGLPDKSGSSIIWGELTTNRMSSTGWTKIYRVLDIYRLDSSRPIMYAQCDVDITLTEGIYWIEWTMSCKWSGAPYQPPITYIGSTTTGDGLQNTEGYWFPAKDYGTDSSQGFPFLIKGSRKLDLPSIDIQPTSFNVYVPVHQTHDETMTISNNGTMELIYDIHVAIQTSRDVWDRTNMTPVVTEMQWPATSFGDGGTIGRGPTMSAPFIENTNSSQAWLTVNPQSGAVSPLSSIDINLHFDADRAGGIGVYNAMLIVSSNDLSANPWEVPVTMNIGDSPMPTATPTHDCDTLGTKLVISQEDLFRAGDEFWLECRICNTNDDPMNGIAIAVLLGVYGEFWFYPSWNAQQAFDFEYRDCEPGLTTFWAIEPFIWPEVGGHAIGLEFYSGLLSAQMDNLIGEYGYLTFGYTDM